MLMVAGVHDCEFLVYAKFQQLSASIISDTEAVPSYSISDVIITAAAYFHIPITNNDRHFTVRNFRDLNSSRLVWKLPHAASSEFDVVAYTTIMLSVQG